MRWLQDGTEMAERVVIAGASSGIGAALAEAMAAPGVHFLLIARRADALQRVAERCQSRGACVVCAALDLRDRVRVLDVVASFARSGGVQMLVANAGVVEFEAWPSDQGPNWDQIRSQIDDNLNCTLSMLEAGLSLPADQRLCLHCVVVCSLNAFLALGEAPGYCTAKAAQKALVEALADFYGCRLSPRAKVRFSTAFPGFVATGMAQNYGGPRPFQLSAEQAATRILRGVRAGRRRIVFPRRLAALQWLGERLPPEWMRGVIASSRAFRGVCP